MEAAKRGNDNLKYAPFMFTSFIIFLLSCGQVIGPGHENAIRGKVLNREGDPVADALINLTYYFKPVLNQNQSMQNYSDFAVVIIRYEVPQQQRVKIWITRYLEKDTMVVLVDAVQNPGYHMVIWDGRNSQNQLARSDVYDVHIAHPNKSVTNQIILNHDYAVYSVVDNLEYYCKTNHDGKFSIPQLDLIHHKIDFELLWTDQQGNPVKVELMPYLKIWALHQNYGNTFKDSVYVNSVRSTELVLQFDV